MCQLDSLSDLKRTIMYTWLANLHQKIDKKSLHGIATLDSVTEA